MPLMTKENPVFLNALLMQVEDILSLVTMSSILPLTLIPNSPCPDITAFTLIFYTGNILGLNRKLFENSNTFLEHW